MREVDEDLFEELWEVEGADRGSSFEVGHFLTGDVGNAARLLCSIAFDSVVRSDALAVFSIVFQQVGSASRVQRHQQRNSRAGRKGGAIGHDRKSSTKETNKEKGKQTK